jgi:hypothetical protein
MKEHLAKCKKTNELYRILTIYSDGVICEITTHGGSVYAEFRKNEEFDFVEREIEKFEYTKTQGSYLNYLFHHLNRYNQSNKFSNEEFDSKLNEIYERLKESVTFKNLKSEITHISIEQFESFLNDLKEEGIDFWC